MTTKETASGALQSLGFSEYEAKVYVTLLERGPMTGYELARAARVPRPNVYPLLDRLEQRGAVTRVQGKKAQLYAAIPSEQMLSSLGRTVESQLADAKRELSNVKPAAPAEYVWNIQGYEQVLERAKTVIDGTGTQLLAGIWSEESRRLSGSFDRAQARGVTISTLCIQGCPDECGGCRGSIYRYPLAAGASTRWLILVADEAQLLAAQVAPDGRASAAATTLEVFASTGAHYLRNAIAAAEIARSVGPRLADLLDERARDAVFGAGLAGSRGSWIEGIMDAVQDTKANG
jgi:predicted transcriptional regulator